MPYSTNELKDVNSKPIASEVIGQANHYEVVDHRISKQSDGSRTMVIMLEYSKDVFDTEGEDPTVVLSNTRVHKERIPVTAEQVATMGAIAPTEPTVYEQDRKVIYDFLLAENWIPDDAVLS